MNTWYFWYGKTIFLQQSKHIERCICNDICNTLITPLCCFGSLLRWPHKNQTSNQKRTDNNNIVYVHFVYIYIPTLIASIRYGFIKFSKMDIRTLNSHMYTNKTRYLKQQKRSYDFSYFSTTNISIPPFSSTQK